MRKIVVDDAGEASEAIDLAEAALRQARPQTRLAAVAAAYGAYGHALAGDRASCDRFYEQARSALGCAAGDDLPWAQFLSTSYIDVHYARGMAALGDYRSAAARFREASAGLDSSYHRDNGVYLAREALAYAGAGELEHAATLGLRALAIGTETRSARIFTELAALEDSFGQASQAPAAAADFRAAMKTAVFDLDCKEGMQP